ncbi:MAG TPA: lysine exporter LysO family protein [Verrucomicrobiae bacterium]|nr:lysine exporter LysO family protein [Verrucomicrobiae bacterium]
MLELLAALGLGIVVGTIKILPQKLGKLALKLSMVGVIVLISSMGAKIGFDPELVKNLALFGWQALVLAVAAVAGSIGMVWWLDKILATAPMQSEEQKQEQELAELVHLDEAAQEKVSYALTYIILGSLVLGMALGYWFIPQSAGATLSLLTDWALYVTLWAVGVDLGRSSGTLKKVWAMGWKVMIAPLGVALGSILGAVLGGLLINLPVNEAAAVGAGFGWYSLSGVLISQIYNVQTGTVAFLSNVLRELIAVLIVPFLAKRTSPLVAVAPGGATTMDTTLPLISAAAGTHTAVIGFVSGFCLSGMVPFLVPLLIHI